MTVGVVGLENMGERHWHGGAPDSFLLHLAISVGPADWLEPVTDDEYEEVVRVLA